MSEVVAFASEYGLRLSVRGGSHHESGSAIAESGLVVDCSGMIRIEVDPDARTVRVGPGVRAGEFHEETQQFGLAAPTGSADDIGIAGSTLGGGIGGTDEDVAGMVYGHNYGRLAVIKDRYDPSNAFRENVTVDPAAD